MYIPLFFVREFKREWEWECKCGVYFDFGFSKEFFLGREVDFFFFEGGG